MARTFVIDHVVLERPVHSAVQRQISSMGLMGVFLPAEFSSMNLKQ